MKSRIIYRLYININEKAFEKKGTWYTARINFIVLNKMSFFIHRLIYRIMRKCSFYSTKMHLRIMRLIDWKIALEDPYFMGFEKLVLAGFSAARVFWRALFAVARSRLLSIGGASRSSRVSRCRRAIVLRNAINAIATRAARRKRYHSARISADC
jgi:hypothetical protein